MPRVEGPSALAGGLVVNIKGRLTGRRRIFGLAAPLPSQHNRLHLGHIGGERRGHPTDLRRWVPQAVNFTHAEKF